MATVNRRSLFQLAGAATLLRTRLAAQQTQTPQPPRRTLGSGGNTEAFPAVAHRSTVAITHSEDRRKNVYEALKAIDRDLQIKMKNKRYAVIKPNFVTTNNQLGGSHADAMRGILDYLSERFHGPVVIAESSAGDTHQGFENYRFNALASEYPKQHVQLIDLNQEAKFEHIHLLDADLHIVPCRIAARLADPEAFVISSCMLKTHNTVIATLSIKNMVLGCPLHSAPGETPRWSEKRKFHVGVRQTHYNMMIAAQRLNWGASLIDGFEGMEGKGPTDGNPVASRIALASTDCVSADRIAAETMGIDPEWLGYVKYCGQVGLGQFDGSKIDVIGAKVADVRKQYKMHPEIERELKWQGPLTELPSNIGWMRPMSADRNG